MLNTCAVRDFSKRAVKAAYDRFLDLSFSMESRRKQMSARQSHRDDPSHHSP